MNPKPPPREEEQSIRARKAEMFERTESPKPTGPTSPTKPFAVYLRETPATPLSGMTKAILWAVGALVVLLLIVGFLRAGRSRTPRRVTASGILTLDPGRSSRTLIPTTVLSKNLASKAPHSFGLIMPQREGLPVS